MNSINEHLFINPDFNIDKNHKDITSPFKIEVIA